MQDFITLAHHLADAAGSIIHQHFRTNFAVESKEDETPVTIVDRTVETRLREIVEKQRPEDGIMGEEYGPKEGKNNYTWVFDPIDGTKSFVIGRPTFGTLIALCENGIPILGIIDQPILKERWIGVKGQRTLFNGKSVQTSSCACPADARLASTSPSQVPDLWPRLYDECGIVVWGGDCYSYGLLANGGLDAVVETGLGTYDFAALPPIVEGAGGLMCDWEGKPLSLSSDGRTLALGTPALKEDFLNLING